MSYLSGSRLDLHHNKVDTQGTFGYHERKVGNKGIRTQEHTKHFVPSRLTTCIRSDQPCDPALTPPFNETIRLVSSHSLLTQQLASSFTIPAANLVHVHGIGCSFFTCRCRYHKASAGIRGEQRLAWDRVRHTSAIVHGSSCKLLDAACSFVNWILHVLLRAVANMPRNGPMLFY